MMVRSVDGRCGGSGEVAAWRGRHASKDERALCCFGFGVHCYCVHGARVMGRGWQLDGGT
jgi:hypothetical protein